MQSLANEGATLWNVAGPVLQTVLGAAIVAGVGFLWKISSTIAELSTDVALIKQAQESQGLDHSRRIEGLEEWKDGAHQRLDKVYVHVGLDGKRKYEGT